MARMASLARRHPYRLDVPLLLIASAVLIYLGLTLPAMETRTLIFWRAEYSILENTRRLHEQGKTTAAFIVLFCSVIYPAGKLLAMMWFWVIRFPATWRRRLMRLLRLMGRWSMVDVLVIAAIVLGSSVIGPLNATPRVGIYCFGAGIALQMVATVLMDRLARKHGRR